MKTSKIDPFYSLKELVAMRVFGSKSINTLRTVARLQTKDMRSHKARLPMSWAAIHSYPRFVMEGGSYGLYESQIIEHRRRKLGE